MITNSVSLRMRISSSIAIGVFLLVISPAAFAQWSPTASPTPSPGTNIYYNSGNVGIGTAAPAQSLDIAKSGGSQIRLYDSNTTTTGVYLGTAGTTYGIFSKNYNPVGTIDNSALPGAAMLITLTSANSQLDFYTSSANNSLGSSRMTIDKSGNVGIGTASPDKLLTVQGSSNRRTAKLISDGDSVGYSGIDLAALTTTNIPDSRASDFFISMRKDTWYGGDGSGPSFIIETGSKSGNNFSAPFTITPTNDILLNSGRGVVGMPVGNVGIGTWNPGFKLDVQGGQINVSGGLCISGVCKTNWSEVSGAIPSVFGRTGAVVAAANDYTWTQINKATSSLADITTRSAGDLNSGTLPDGRFPATLPAASGANLTSLNASNLASGTVAPTRLGSGTADTTTFLRGDNTWIAVTSSQWTAAGTNNINYAPSGNVGIGVSGTPTAKLDVNGTAHVSGNMTVDGNLAAKYQDVAEWVPSSQQLPAGTVVILDSSKSNQVTSSTVSYDTRVAGVVSAQPGITLGEKADNKVLVATTGRVRVMVDASRGPIAIGDLLVTSDIPGVAMKSEAVNLGGVQIHRPGTLIGKALEPLEKGRGTILVLLSLQ